MHSFTQLVQGATGHAPYRWQTRVAEGGLPDLVAVETGAGKTAGAVLGWLWRRHFHSDPAVRAATPHWLVYCLPMRVLVEQVEAAVRTWLQALGLQHDVGVHVALGGREPRDVTWRLHPERDAVVVGTVDMLLSRALNRGYAASRFAWPIDFGLLHNGTQWVFDELQLLGPGLATGRQLQGLRDRIGTVLPTRSTWMSATVDLPALSTVDNPELGSVVELDADDRVDPLLAARLSASKSVSELPIDPKGKRRAAEVASAVAQRNRPGTLTLVVVNTVRSAREIYAEVRRAAPDVEAVLLHSRFRPPDRRAAAAAALGPVDADGPGRVVVATQVVEAGVDISAATLVTEAAPWPSIVQRAGRCNRDGRAPDAELLWLLPPGPPPYEAADVDAAVAALRQLEGALVTSSSLREQPVAVARPVQPVLRRRDLYGLFDTAPDLSGNDIDVAPLIRTPTDEIDLHVAWRQLDGGKPADDEPTPTPDELCPAPVADVRQLLKRGSPMFRFDHLARGDNRWRRLAADEVRPGLVVLADASVGGYTPATGWDPGWRAPVPPLPADDVRGLVVPEETLGDETLSQGPQWVPLTQHLADTGRQARSLLAAFASSHLDPELAAAAVRAAELHDVGKTHEVWQRTVLGLADGGERTRLERDGPWAKSAVAGRLRHERPFFRHELASALALLDEGGQILRGTREADLVVYLVAAHHGRVRLGVRSIPEEERSGYVLGIADGDTLPPVVTPAGQLPPSRLSLAVTGLGAADGVPSWTERALTLLHRPDIGPFRLGWLEAVVRLADWRASAHPGEATADA